jgi:hypothetical protein
MKLCDERKALLEGEKKEGDRMSLATETSD